MSVETDIAIMLAFILSPSRCRPVKDEHLWCGDHAISRGVLGLSFQGPRGAGAPCSGSRYLVPVASGVQRFFRNLSTFFSFGIPIEKRVADLSRSGSGVSSVCRPSGTGMPCGLLPTAAVEGRRRGRGYMVDPIRPGKFFRSLLIVFSILSTSCG